MCVEGVAAVSAMLWSKFVKLRNHNTATEFNRVIWMLATG